MSFEDLCVGATIHLYTAVCKGVGGRQVVGCHVLHVSLLVE